MIVAPDLGFNSLLSLGDSDAFHLARGNTAWQAATTSKRETALVRATDYILTTYRFFESPIFNGMVHPSLKAAVALLALEALTIDLFTTAHEPIKTSESSELGPLKTSTVYRSPLSDRFPRVTMLLDGIAAPYAANVGYGVIIR